jgi:hypothetical protein
MVYLIYLMVFVDMESGYHYFRATMRGRYKLAKLIGEKKAEIASLETALNKEKAFLAGLEQAEQLIPADADSGAAVELRAGTDLAKARDILREARMPLHVDELLKRMGKEVNKKTKGALAGSIGYYIRQGIVFIKTGPNIFGLVEFEKTLSVVPADVEDIEEEMLGN